MSGLWPVPVRLSEVGRAPVRRELVADEATRKRIARALNLTRLDSLEATVAVTPWLDGAQVDGRWSASLEQACVVTLDPLPASLKGVFTVRAVPADSDAAPQEGQEIDLDPEADDPPDVLDGETLDIGAYVVEHLGLEIDPFPRTLGAEFQPPESSEPESPFAVLRRLKGEGGEG